MGILYQIMPFGFLKLPARAAQSPHYCILSPSHFAPFNAFLVSAWAQFLANVSLQFLRLTLPDILYEAFSFSSC